MVLLNLPVSETLRTLWSAVEQCAFCSICGELVCAVGLLLLVGVACA